ncbi:hypothetical protein J2S49_000718 [Arcanobacterium wilhelmae]|uniref:Uncharacterized protein n=1 Tax=Arcanobacterium wilhelmae TaxID=1803177 RepID=A0ABT9NAC7_9ACTO|nr:hypothetical protein [Arcanobacterium wilhelmae]
MSLFSTPDALVLSTPSRMFAHDSLTNPSRRSHADSHPNPTHCANNAYVENCELPTWKIVNSLRGRL